VSLVDDCKRLLSNAPLFLAINGYASGYSQLAYRYNLANLIQKYGGGIESGELTIRESKGHRLLPCGIFAQWRGN